MKAFSFFALLFLLISPLYADDFDISSPQENMYEVTTHMNKDYVFRVDCNTPQKIIISDVASSEHEVYGCSWSRKTCKHNTGKSWTILNKEEKPGYYIWRHHGCCHEIVFLRMLNEEHYFSVLVTIKRNKFVGVEFIKTNQQALAMAQEILWLRASMAFEEGELRKK